MRRERGVSEMARGKVTGALRARCWCCALRRPRSRQHAPVLLQSLVQVIDLQVQGHDLQMDSYALFLGGGEGIEPRADLPLSCIPAFFI